MGRYRRVRDLDKPPSFGPVAGLVDGLDADRAGRIGSLLGSEVEVDLLLASVHDQIRLNRPGQPGDAAISPGSGRFARS